MLNLEERLAAYLEAIAARNPSLNAYVQVAEDRALENAASGSGFAHSLIDGWCVAVKDNIDVAGLVTSNGMPGGEVATEDAAVVARLRQAGAVILGKTNLHEAALGSTTVNPHFGPTHNPLRQGHIAGGSSGGSAAAVAAGLCDAALGTDTMGSVRVPAACCGVVGFKPTFDSIPVEGVAPLCWSLDHVGPITRNVADARAMFLALADQPPPVSAPIRPRIVRLAPFEALPLSPIVAEGYTRALRTVERTLGPAPVTPLPGFEPTALRYAALLAIEADAAAIHSNHLERASPELRRMLDYGVRMPATKLALAREQLRQARKAILRLFAEADLIVSPTIAETAFAIDQPAPPGHSDFMGLAVFAGAPAISLPIETADLPAGLQLIAAPGRDLALLDWAAQIEDALRHA